MGTVDHWITTHWPVPDPSWPRHVFVKPNRKTVPQPKDIVFVYEAKYATVNDKRVKRVRRVRGDDRGVDEVLDVGFGGIIGVMFVESERRDIWPDDVVYEYGNLNEFQIIPCRDFHVSRLSHADLLAVLGMHPDAPPTPFSLCKIQANRGAALMARLRLGADR